MSKVSYLGNEWNEVKGDTTTEYLFLKKLVNGKTGKGRPHKVRTELVQWLPEDVQLELDITPEQVAVNAEVETETVLEM